MADKFHVAVDARKVVAALERAEKREVKKAERASLLKITRAAAAVAKGEADTGARKYIKSRVRTERRGPDKGKLAGKVFVSHGGYRLLAGGTRDRHTKSGKNTGFVVADAFMERAAAKVDPVAARDYQRELGERLRATGLSIEGPR